MLPTIPIVLHTLFYVLSLAVSLVILKSLVSHCPCAKKGKSSSESGATAKVLTKIEDEELAAQAEIVREMIRHEDDLLNHRFTWLAVIQTFLFAASTEVLGKNCSFIPLILCCVGVVTAFSTWTVMESANRAIVRTLAKWKEIKPKGWNKTHIDVIGLRANHSSMHFSPWGFLPLMFIVAWMALYGINIANGPSEKPAGCPCVSAAASK